MGDLSWRDRAACKGVETKIFFPHDTLKQTRWDEGLAVWRTAIPALSGCRVWIWRCRLILLMIVGVCLVGCYRVSVVRCVVGTVTLKDSMQMAVLLE
jgi:hypothetical protein